MINRELIIENCKLEMGEHEEPIGSNKTKFGAWYGMNGVSWCAIFVAYIMFKSGIKLKIDKGFKGFHYVPTLHARAKQKGWLTTTPKKGDIVLFDFKPNDGKEFAQHVGIYDGRMYEGKYVCYEGNTSSGELGSQDNGDCVANKPRDNKFILGIVSLDKLVEAGYAIEI